MSILDDAIREHLELKRAHGADDSELQKLEDEAFGPPQRPDQADPFAEAPTEFLVSPTEQPVDAPTVGEEAARDGRRPDIADLQEAPPVPTAPGPEDATAPSVPAEELVPAPDAPAPSPADAADVPPPPADEAPAEIATPAPAVPSAEAPTPAASPSSDAEAPAPAAPESPAAEEPLSGKGEIAVDAGPSTEERHAIADQPTQMFDVQAHVDAEGEAPPAAEPAPSDEQLVDAAQSEPQASPPAPEDAAPTDAPPATETAPAVPPEDAPPTAEPEQQPLDIRGPDAEVAGHPPTEEESAEFDFFNEQRLSDELDQALEAPLPPTDEHIAMPQYGDAPPPQPAKGGIFDFESEGSSYEEDPSEEVLRRHDAPEPPEAPSEEAPRNLFDPPSEEFESPSEEYEAPSQELDPPSEETEPPSEEAPRADARDAEEEDDAAFDPDTGHEDVLEDRPKFLEDDEDEVWFEQKPPKDFDLD